MREIMTIEFSLRCRAKQARLMAILWLGLAAIVLVATYASLPYVAKKTLYSITTIETQNNETRSNPPLETSEAKSPFRLQLYALGTLTLGVLVISFACFLLGRTAFVEIELAARFSGIADALCIAGDSMEHLEKAAGLLVPAAKYLSVPEIFSVRNIQSLAELAKQVKSV
jgi:hypothetical protein